jgi:hypothetical protein
MTDDGVNRSLTAAVIAIRAYRSNISGSLVLCVSAQAVAKMLNNGPSSRLRCSWLPTMRLKISRAGLVSGALGVMAGRMPIEAIGTMFDPIDLRPLWAILSTSRIKWTFR